MHIELILILSVYTHVYTVYNLYDVGMHVKYIHLVASQFNLITLLKIMLRL